MYVLKKILSNFYPSNVNMHVNKYIDEFKWVATGAKDNLVI